jgi:hypothetical protein
MRALSQPRASGASAARPAPRLSTASARLQRLSRLPATKTPSTPAAALQKGDLVLVERDGDAPPHLILLTRPDGKLKWFGTDAVRVSAPRAPQQQL